MKGGKDESIQTVWVDSFLTSVNCAVPSKQQGLSLSPVVFMAVLYLQMTKHN